MLRRCCARLRLPLIRRLPSAFAEYGGGARKNLGPAVRISFDATIMLNLRENLPHSDEITSLYQVAAAPPQPTPIRRAAACGGVAPAARGPGAAAPSRACAGAGCRGAALAVCACPRGRARCPPPGGLRAPLPAAPQSGAAAGLCGASAAAAASRSVPRGGAAPRAVAPRRSLRPARPRAAALRSGRGRPRAARACFSPAPARPSAAALVAAVAARRARSLAPAARRRLRRRRRAPGWGRRGAPQRPLFPRLSALGACAASFPLRVARRLAVLGLGRPRRARAPLRRGPAVGRPRGGFWRPLRRPPLWRFAPPRVGLGFRRCGGGFFAAAAARCCRAPPAAVWLRPRCSLPCLRLRLPAR